MSEKESHLTDQKSVEMKSSVETKSSVEKNISVQNDKDTDTGLVNHGLKIGVTASSPFRRRYDARRAVRTHSCRETRSGIKPVFHSHISPTLAKISPPKNVISSFLTP